MVKPTPKRAWRLRLNKTHNARFDPLSCYRLVDDKNIDILGVFHGNLDADKYIYPA